MLVQMVDCYWTCAYVGTNAWLLLDIFNNLTALFLPYILYTVLCTEYIDLLNYKSDDEGS
jgi:hypothetical protein